MLLLVLILHSIVLCYAQNQTIWTELATLTPVKYHLHAAMVVEFLASHIKSNTQLLTLFSQNTHNITLFLPTDAAINASIQTGALNFSLSENNTYSALAFLTLDARYSSEDLLSKQPFAFPTLDSNVENSFVYIHANNTNTLQLNSGSDQANIVQADLNCLNGVIHLVDYFLQPPETPLDTISKLADTELLEGLLKSLNISNIVSKSNHTIFAAVNEALANSSTLPFGTLVHNLKFMSVQGIYYSCDLGINQTLLTDYRKNTLTVVPGLAIQGQTEDDVARLLVVDITTSMGVLHVVDRVLSADLDTTSTLPSSSTEDNDPLSDIENGGGNTRPVSAPVVSSASNVHINLVLMSWLLSIFVHFFL
ncbi:hypothetical protein K501DRAFT_334178 [Backusella circina FSU 941]|nr:hypothetical protein K501DRAFT_334178 [Backusella circina FSU 941]